MKNKLLILILLVTLTGCYSTKNTAKVKTGVTAAYIAPKGFNETTGTGKEKKTKTNLSSGAYFFDGSMRMGVSNVINKTDGKNDYDVKYLAEEQPDVAREFVRTLTAKAKADIESGSEPAVKAEAELMTSLTNNIEKLTSKSASLNLSRSILYRLNESLYNGVPETEIVLFQKIAEKLIELQEKEFEATILTEKSKVLSELKLTIAELQKAGFEKDKILEIIEKLLSKTE
jgi:hypothetical protein